MKLSLRIEGMTCAHCVAAVGAALRGVAGVEVTSVTIGAAELTAPQGSAGAVIDALAASGYSANER